jgi:tetratricopeptide (TPR) repeat protein
MSSATTRVPATNAVTPASVTDGPALAPGEHVGRYEVKWTLGGGGMGVVYAAIDPELQRQVAIKVVRPRLGGSPVEAQARLLREAQMLAQLSHPNVVTVHDVGAFGDDVFVAMEFVEGITLRDYAEDFGRRPEEVVEAYMAAGRGLAAAHAVGVIHRDVKPDNLMITKDGRVLVLDFGLARNDPASASNPSSPDSLTEEDMSLTATGLAMGTPAYMAPEQHAGEATPASDQYSFCASLFEGLVGERPFGGTDMRTLQREKLSRFETVAMRPEIPKRLQPVLRRGLDPIPEDRFVDMDELLAAMDLRRRRLWPVTVGAGIVVLGGAVAASVPSPDPCDAIADSPGSWTEATRAEVGEALRGVEATYAAVTAQTVLDRLDAQAAALVAAEHRACELARESGDDRTIDLRHACLERRRAEFDAVLAALTAPSQADEPSLAEHAVDVVLGLRSAAVCDEPDESSRGPSTSVTDPVEYARVRAEMERLIVLAHAGRFEAAAAGFDALLPAAQSLAYAPLLAELHLLRGRNADSVADHERAVTEFLSAIDAAADAQMDHLAAEAWIELTSTTGHSLARYDEARELLRSAEAAVDRVGDDPQLRSTLVRVEGQLAFDLGNYDEAQARFEEALSLLNDQTSKTGRAPVVSALARTYARAGRSQEAEKLYVGLLEELEAELGPGHPRLSKVHAYLAQMYFERGELEEALRWHEKGLAITEATLPADHPELAFALNNVAGIYGMLGRFDEAVRAYDRARTILEKRLGPSHPNVARLTYNVAELWKLMGDRERARDEYLRAVTIFEEGFGTQHPDVARARNNLAAVQFDMGDIDAALANYGESVRILEEVLGPDEPGLAYPLTGLGQCRIERQEYTAAAAQLRRALKLREGPDTDPVDRADTQYALSRALYSDRATRVEALELLDAAEAVYVDAGEVRATELGNLRDWRRSLR